MSQCDVFRTDNKRLEATINAPSSSLSIVCAAIISFHDPKSNVRFGFLSHGSTADSNVRIKFKGPYWNPLENEEEIIVEPGKTVNLRNEYTVTHNEDLK